MSYEERIGRAVLELTTDRRKFDQGIRHAHREAKGLDSQFQDVGSSLQMVATRALALGAIAFGGTRFVQGLLSARMELERIENTLESATGSQRAARQEFAFIADEADRLGFGLSTAALEYAKLTAASRGTVLEGQATREIFVAIAEASTVMGLSAAETGGALTAIQQIISKGTVSAEELRGQLGERLPGAFQIAARAMGVTTSELGEMLQRGEVLAEDLLPKLARELRTTFGPQVRSAAGSLRSEFNRLGNEVELLTGMIGGEVGGGLTPAVSGLTIALKAVREELESLAEDEGQSANEWGERFGIMLGFGVDRLTQWYGLLSLGPEFLAAYAASFEASMDGTQEGIEASRAVWKAYMDEVRAGLDLLDSPVLDRVNESLAAANVPGNAPPSIEPRVDIARSAPRLDMLRTTLEYSTEEDEKRRAKARRQALDLEREAARIYEDTRKPLERYNATVAAYLDHLRQGRIDQDTYNRAVGQAGEAYRDAAMASEEATDDMSQFALQASRNMQTAFADFLFDPFDEGLEGMAEAFANTLRRMVAEAAAAQILGAIFPGGGLGGFLGGGLGSLFGGFRANGGPVSAGKAYVVGERGPEMFVPGQSGRVVANGEGEQVVININAPGADARTIEQIRIIGQTELVPQAVAAARSSVLSQLSRPRFA